MRPVFRNGRIVAYTVSITHLPDIGGTGFGSSATDVFQEGCRVCRSASYSTPAGSVPI